MDLESRMNGIVKVLNETDGLLSAREVTERYMPEPGKSDPLSTLNVLNVMAHLGLVKKVMVWKSGRTARYKYARTGNHMITVNNGIA